MVDLEAFIKEWSASAAAEQPHKDAFLLELCDVLGVDRPRPRTGDPDRDRFSFESSTVQIGPAERASARRIDLYKRDCFLLEAKQGSNDAGPKRGIGRRDTPAWNLAMRDAFGQALGYAATLDHPPPFLVVCDIGYCFDLYADFDGSVHYRPFPDARSSRIFLADLVDRPELLDRLRRVFVDPGSLDPSRQQLRVTREVAVHLAELAQELENAGQEPEKIATFLMRCLFTMFAEDVGLLPGRPFTYGLEKWWLPNPPSFVLGVVSLWQTMKDGGAHLCGEIRKFGGSLFAMTSALELTRPQLELLLEAARRDWSEVEPAVFGTLLERALDPVERQRLGAHFTPRSYVERLVRPAVEEPLRREWDRVRVEVRDHVRRGWYRRARRVVQAFHERLCCVRVLDPACGSGNFLYVTLDLLKRLESEVLSLLGDLGGPRQELLGLRGNTVTPDQFHGIEVKRWAREIAELVLWIGYLQWQVRNLGSATDIPEPVLRDYGNFELRDALLDFEAKALVTDASERPVTRWDGVTYRSHPVTGQSVPDEDARVSVFRYLDPRPAEWPAAEFIVGNPPFVGNKRMRAVLGDPYVEALRSAYPEVPGSAEFVMYWWSKAARLVQAGEVERFGLITTNSITQRFNRRVVAGFLDGDPPLSLEFALPDHPWMEGDDGAAVRIAMTVVGRGTTPGLLVEIAAEEPAEKGARVDLLSRRGRIHPDLRIGPDVSRALPLRANAGLCGQGIKVVGNGFYVDTPFACEPSSPVTGAPVLRRIVGTRDVLEGRPGSWIIDFFGLAAGEAERLHPLAFQRLLTHVKPVRDQNRRASIRELWWRFAWERPVLRQAISGLERYLVTPSVSKHRLFVLLPASTLPDGSLFAIALDDPFFLGILSSRVHRAWALAAGGRIGAGNDPTWTHGSCFEPFPFPDPKPALRDRIRILAERIHGHRSTQLQNNPELSLTEIYNVVDAIERGSALSREQRALHDRALISSLARAHELLDQAVLEAYGWPPKVADDEILERLVDLNSERAREEAGGRVRWLRPHLQRPTDGLAEQPELPVGWAPIQGAREAALLSWPGKLPDRAAAIRDLLSNARAPLELEQLIESLPGARSREVEEVLRTLAAVGVAVALETPDGRRWRALERVVA